MTTLYASKRDLTVSIGFMVVVAAAIAASTLIRGSTVLGGVFVVVAVGLVVLAIVLRRLPATELRVSNDLIELARPGRTIGSLSYAATDGHVEVKRYVDQGRASWSLVPAGGGRDSGFLIDDFVLDEIRSTAERHGWMVDIVE